MRMAEEIREGRETRRTIRRQGRRSLVLDALDEAEELAIDLFLSFVDNLPPPPLCDDGRYHEKEKTSWKGALIDSKPTTMARLYLHVQKILPKARPRAYRSLKQPGPPLSRRKQHRGEYTWIQNYWNKNRKRCIENILYGTSNTNQPSREVMESFWERVLTQASNSVPNFEIPQKEKSDLWSPITTEEVERICVSRKTASGPNSLTGRDLTCEDLRKESCFVCSTFSCGVTNFLSAYSPLERSLYQKESLRTSLESTGQSEYHLSLCEDIIVSSRGDWLWALKLMIDREALGTWMAVG